ncbi:GvpT/GvpP family gas vesicle accessory protein [Alkalihalophilus lindianensis]|uniref:GvpT/GvpP family gas vesicle accessory protein n=1 Tax=Alkalihalophilus lindianensis TaxID=1630542 RepID=A0ABU3X9V8_9BACI|nr:GvpT/GvpP family gas vesicle accessory protein [Alkalihalophilus lindianensis]MDV2684668.1 GvpT/GvpP family gas vesicle accessory protein [Alkalihalophilus lindianensis]
MADKEQKNQNNDENTESKNDQSHSMNLAIIGGVVGAGIGLLSSPGTSKKVMKSLGESEVMRSAGKELKRTAQEIITEQALSSLRQTASGYMNGGGLLSPKKKNNEQEDSNESSNEDNSSEYEEIKEDNKQLNDRLERIEEMLSNLVDSKK